MSFSRFFNAWKFVTPEKVVVKLPFHSLKAEELIFNKMDYCIQGNQIILTFERKLKAPERNAYKDESRRNESFGSQYSDKTDPIWR